MTTKNTHKRAKVLGPPGTGKTTYLLELLEKATKKYDPDRIGAVSLTNAAVEEMRDRVHKHTKVKPRHIRTIHSTCFNLLDLKTSQVADKKIKEFNEAFPKWAMPLNTEITEDEQFQEFYDKRFSPQANKQRFGQIQILRHSLVPEEKWEDELSADKSRDPALLKDMYKDWTMWMWENNYVDFTRMLEMVLEQGLRPEIDVLLVDEAQDVSRLGIDILEMWSRDCISTVFVGDSDQAILRFAGAVPEAFMNLNHTWMKVLDKSYRIPRKVHEYAMSIIRKAMNREDVEYKARNAEGKIYGLNLLEPDLSLEGTHMILGRCNFHLNKWRKYLLEKKIAFHNPYRPGDRAWNPLNTKVWRAARSYVKLSKGEDITGFELKNMVMTMKSEGNVVRGTKSRIDDLFEVSGITFKSRIDLFKAIGLGIFTEELCSFKKEVGELFKVEGTQSGELLGRVEDVLEEPKVVIGTIHCSPPDEPILTTNGWMSIRGLDPDIDRLSGYDRKSNRLYWGGVNGPKGTRKKGGYPFTKTNRFYTGTMFTLETSRSRTQITPDHRLMARFLSSFFQKHIVYLMRRGNWWRIGNCTSGHRPYKAGGLSGRLSTEQADAGWILGIFETRKEAVFEETRIQGLYGIPGITFQSVSKGRSLTTKQLHSIHTEISSETSIRAKKLLGAFGLKIDYPLYNRGVQTTEDIKRNMSRAFLTVAANLWDEYMEILVAPKSFYDHGPGIQRPEFLKFKITKKHYDGVVFSLDVQPYHYYISGGAVVHNSVKGGESDHVWIDKGTSYSCLVGCQGSREVYWDEIRVGYVGVSRGRIGVGLLVGEMENMGVW